MSSFPEFVFAKKKLTRNDSPFQFLAYYLIGKRNGSTAGKVFFSTLLGTGVGSLVMLPLTVMVVYPLGKLAEALGLVNRSAIPTDVATTLVYAAMMAIWLIVGIALGTMLSLVTIKKSKQADFQRPAAEHGL